MYSKKYENHSGLPKSPKLLPIPSNKKLNAYLKELADICGITTRLTFHIARHTFATTVSLENGVPIDSVSKMLGHRSICGRIRLIKKATLIFFSFLLKIIGLMTLEVFTL